MLYADVVLPLALDNLFTYSVPDDMQERVSVGHRVIVPFGRRKYYTAIVINLHENAPTEYEVKPIESVVDSYPIINEQQIKLWQWIAFYYMCYLGEVYIAAVPARLKLESETFLSVFDNDSSLEGLTPIEIKIMHFIREKGTQKISDISKELKIRDMLPYAHSLVYSGLVEIEDQVIERYKPKTETYIKLNPEINDTTNIIGKAKKQQDLYEVLKDAFEKDSGLRVQRGDIDKKYGFSNSILRGLIDKGIVIQYTEEISRINPNVVISREAYQLNIHQQAALEEINNIFEKKSVCLLHGVTSSGKTEVYIHLIEEHLKKGRQVLFLVPEIALTTQLTLRLQAVFGDRLGIYHSRINDNERAEIWLKMQSESPFEVVIGVRSSIFLPYQSLGLIIVDEEHEVGYKQMDPSPRYHARDTAIVMAHNFDAKVLLGSATPSIESYHNAITGKYGLVEMHHRFEDIEMPRIELENTKELRRKKIMKSVLTPKMIEGINSALGSGQQVILFRNRRGFAPLLECKHCGWTPKCQHCDVSLTYHKFHHQLKCHYCNSSYHVVDECPVCKTNSVEQLGMGTEMLEEEVAQLFPNAMVERMDTDTTRGKNSYEQIIADFEEKRTDILVGTQMLSKGLDFDNVSLVGIIAADGLLNHPNFRSHERGFQLMMQASGRAGRKGQQGRVIVQAADPEISLFKYLQANDYVSFYHLQLNERRLFNYPPYTRLISIVLKHRNEGVVDSGAHFFASSLRNSLGNMVLGPNVPVISYIKRQHIREILLKLDTNLNHVKVREFIRYVEHQFRGHDRFKYVQLNYDVDVV